jgi:hypothetical protein
MFCTDGWATFRKRGNSFPTSSRPVGIILSSGNPLFVRFSRHYFLATIKISRRFCAVYLDKALDGYRPLFIYATTLKYALSSTFQKKRTS